MRDVEYKLVVKALSFDVISTLEDRTNSFKQDVKNVKTLKTTNTIIGEIKCTIKGQ